MTLSGGCGLSMGPDDPEEVDFSVSDQGRFDIVEFSRECNC